MTTTLSAKSHSGIPESPWIESVDVFLQSRDQVEPKLQEFQELIQKYKYMESQLVKKASGLAQKIPDIDKTLMTVKEIQKKTEQEEDADVLYELNDTLKAHASIPPTKEVYLWLGV
ncbi:Prefoldin subunit 3 [Neolecta irregularis DAH-3]|uniref:Prefoldin subunit 3 n=1 Tax=Neolecta irregularis (strain DAH-3) TaxID=1198029 RepID=A0A1U7LVD5_NEOID|nr:Prefoldin subunit 3 [Neolecta irregularis DAH-3]|eukprot:OLL26604.1 Prefoldin subunit 3 [Neolecta irregularis DAH-3]